MTEWRRDRTTSTAAPVGLPAASGGGLATAAQQFPYLDRWPAVTVTLSASGPDIGWAGGNPDDLMLMAVALLDAARAARNGDDPTEVARQEWHRRGGRPDLD